MSAPIVFDGSVFGAGPTTGVGRALVSGIEAYAAIATRPFVLLLPEGAAPPVAGDGIELLRGLPRGYLARSRAIVRTLRRLGAALLHSPVAALPPAAPCPMVATVHDVPFGLRPKLGGEDLRLRHRLAVRLAARRAAALLCVSRTTRHDLLRWLGRRPRASVRVVPIGVEPPVRPAGATELNGPLIVIATDRPRKNLPRVRRAHALARELETSVPPLRVIGPPDAWVDDDEKLRALRTSTALLNVSLFEGFGLPVVEAFQHGVPVLCSDRGALREVAGDAALTVDPTDERAIAEAIVRIATDARLRAELRARGLERGDVFTARRTAERWLRIHDEVSG